MAAGGLWRRLVGYAAEAASDSTRSLVRLGSTLIPGPMVEAITMERMYLPLAADVRAGLLGLARLVALGEDGDLDLLAQPVRQRDRAAQLLVRVADVQAGADVHLDRLVELGPLGLLDELDGLLRGVLVGAIHL